VFHVDGGPCPGDELAALATNMRNAWHVSQFCDRQPWEGGAWRFSRALAWTPSSGTSICCLDRFTSGFRHFGYTE
jgi:hypothetical protein